MKNNQKKVESNFFENIIDNITEAISNFFQPILSWIEEFFGSNSTEVSSENKDAERQKFARKRQSIIKIEELKFATNIESSDLDSAVKCFVSDYVKNGVDEAFFEADDEGKFTMIKNFIEFLAKKDPDLKDSHEVTKLFNNRDLKNKIIEKCNELTAIVGFVNQSLNNHDLTTDSSIEEDRVLKKFLEHKFKSEGDIGGIDMNKICMSFTKENSMYLYRGEINICLCFPFLFIFYFLCIFLSCLSL